MYDAYQQQVHECDTEIEQVIIKLSAHKELPDKPLPKAKHRTKQPNQLNFDVRERLYHLVGADFMDLVPIWRSE